MSVEISTWVFKHSESVGSDRLVLLVLADNANDETWTCYPGVKLIARKARVSEATVRRSLKSLEASGRITIVKNGGPAYRGDRRPNLYTVCTESPEDEVPELEADGVSDCNPVNLNREHGVSSPVDKDGEGSDGVSNEDDGVSSGAHGVSNLADGVSLLTPKPSFLKPSKEPSFIKPSDFCNDALLVADLFAGLIEANGVTRPKVTVKWLTDLDRMHRLDGVPWGRIEGAIRFAMNDDFWHQNILSPAKLRKHYDRLVLKAQQERAKSKRTTEGDRYLQEQMSMIQEQYA